VEPGEDTMVKAYVLDITREVEVAVLFETMVGHRPQPREMYRTYQCKKCGKINPNVISAAGLPPLDLSSIRLDYFETEDGFTVVSASFAQFLKEMCGDAVKCLAIGETGYYLLQCRDHVAPPADSRLYTPIEPADPNDVFQVRGKQCPKCGRFRVVTYQPEAFPFPEEFTIFAFDIEQPLYLATSICCSPILAKQISARRLKGLRLIPIN
jgi:predicted RNA-binding Zn-ribbon protein involved in translation (DUF1610 family)